MVMRKRKFRRFRRRARKFGPGRSLATKSYVKKLVHKESETKFFDTTPFNGSGIDTTGSFAILSGVAQGIQDSQRIGDKLTLRACRIAYTMVPGDPYNVVRIVVFQWYPNTVLTIPTASLIVEALGINYMAPIRHDHVNNQFKVLYDKRFTMVLPAAAGIGADSSVRTGNIIVPMKWVRKSVDFTSASTNAANHLYVYVVSDSAIAANPSITLTSRIWYDDS